MPDGMSVVRVEDTRYALSSIADMFFGHPSEKFNLIGITGLRKDYHNLHDKISPRRIRSKGGTYRDNSEHDWRGDADGQNNTESYDLQELFSEMVQKM